MPSPAIDFLMREHRAIEQVLTALDGCAQALERGAAVERPVFSDFAEFFASFADKRHHAKEEAQLFVRMEACGMPAEEGPIAVMLAEHAEGREHVAALRRIGTGEGELTAAERQEAIDHARAFVPLLREHIMKEDEILYPMAENLLPRTALHEMAAAFETLDAEATGGGSDRDAALARSLIARFGG